MRGALIGLALEIFTPALLVFTIPLAAMTGAWWLCVPQVLMLFAIWAAVVMRRFPWWLVTPDDPVSPFGQYEPTVRKIYDKFGPVLGDFYWLAWRNVLYGLLYYFKPDRYKNKTEYGQYQMSVAYPSKWLTVWMADGLKLYQVNLGKFEILAGWMVRGVVMDPFTRRSPVNMEFRPTFSIRRAG